MKLNGHDIEKAKGSFEALKKRTADYEESLKSFKKFAKDNEELQNQSKKQKDEFEATVHGLKLNSAVKDALASAHVRNAKAVKCLLDMDKVGWMCACCQKTATTLTATSHRGQAERPQSP